ncbi:hypothetical protein HNQ08_002135 [Deinococcus humi]|uniref:Uncharacterized protein n=1 Tax=Deinococcus humi TaxID=662880 RepID=A0A7W8JTM2_9DEIO|nr:hypothetical protein [Deinococcus humi]
MTPAARADRSADHLAVLEILSRFAEDLTQTAELPE